MSRRRARRAVVAAVAVMAVAGLAWWAAQRSSGGGAPAEAPDGGGAASGTPPAGAPEPTGRQVRRSGPLSERVRVTRPTAGATVASPLVVTGEAPGAWHFEAVFPLRLEAADGRTVAEGSARALEPWTTERNVPFRGVLRFASGAEAATLVLERANPSGRPEHEARVRVPVRLAGPDTSGAGSGPPR